LNKQAATNMSIAHQVMDFDYSHHDLHLLRTTRLTQGNLTRFLGREGHVNREMKALW